MGKDSGVNPTARAGRLTARLTDSTRSTADHGRAHEHQVHPDRPW